VGLNGLDAGVVGSIPPKAWMFVVRLSVLSYVGTGLAIQGTFSKHHKETAKEKTKFTS
jgi:hypothetical protein